MADIKRKLRLSAELDPRSWGELKRKIGSLREEVNKAFKLEGSALAGFSKAAESLKEAAKELRSAAAELKKARTGPMGGPGGGGGLGGVGRQRQGGGQNPISFFNRDRMGGNITEGVYTAQQNETLIMGQKALNLKKGDLVDISAKKKILDITQAINREQETGAKLKLQAEKASLRKSQQITKNKEQLQNTVAAMLASKAGVPGLFAREFGQQGMRRARNLFSGEDAGKFARGRAFTKGRTALGLGRAGMMAAGAFAGIAGGVVLALGLNARTMEASRAHRELAARENQEAGLSQLSGRGLEGIIKKRSRTARGFRESAEEVYRAGTGFISAFNPFSEDFLSNPIEAARANMRRVEEKRQQTNLAESELGLAGLGIARGSRESRLNLMRGGGISGQQLTAAQGAGAGLGFSLEETLAQATQARGSIGNRALFGINRRENIPGMAELGGATRGVTNLEAMQDIFQRTGVSVGQQAQSAEIFAGAQGGTMGGGVARTIEMLKKGVAAGLDASKSGQFLKVTADYIASTQGLGQVDVERISDSMRDLSAGFARGGDVTQTQLNQARSLQEMQKKESMGQGGGLAAIGNFMAIQALGPDISAQQYMLAQTISKDATPEDVMEMLGVDEDTAKAFLKAKQDNLQIGAQGVGYNKAGQTAAIARERGISGEQAFTSQKAQQFKKEKEDRRAVMKAIPELFDPQEIAEEKLGEKGFLPGVEKGKELESKIIEAKTGQAAFVEGMGLMAKETGLAQENLVEFNKQLKKSIELMGGHLGEDPGQNSSKMDRFRF